MRGIVKQFPGARALDGVDLEVRAGEVHCLLGQNGAGKSTLIKVLAGAHQPDEGEILVDGEPVTIPHPVAGLKLGIATIYQELDVVDGLTVAENIYLGHELATAGFSQRRAATANTARAAHAARPPRDLAAPRGRPAVGRRQADRQHGPGAVARRPRDRHGRAVGRARRRRRSTNLFRVVRELTAPGVAVVYISHRLEEIRQIGDRITVLKDGRTVATGPAGRGDPDRRAHPADDRPQRRVRLPAARRRSPTTPRPCCTVDGLALRGRVQRRVVRRARGRGRRPRRARRLRPLGDPRDRLRRPQGDRRHRPRSASRRCAPARCSDAVDAGIGLCPEERKSQGLILDEPVYRNITLSTFTRFANASFLDEGAERTVAQRADRGARRPAVATSTAARAPCPAATSRRSLLARWLVHGCRVLLLDEPTRGVDVGARAEIYAPDRATSPTQGAAVVVVSSEIAGGARPVRPGAGDLRRARGPRRAGVRHRRAPRARPRHGRKCRVSEQNDPEHRARRHADESRRGSSRVASGAQRGAGRPAQRAGGPQPRPGDRAGRCCASSASSPPASGSPASTTC